VESWREAAWPALAKPLAGSLAVWTGFGAWRAPGAVATGFGGSCANGDMDCGAWGKTKVGSWTAVRALRVDRTAGSASGTDASANAGTDGGRSGRAAGSLTAARLLRFRSSAAPAADVAFRDVALGIAESGGARAGSRGYTADGAAGYGAEADGDSSRLTVGLFRWLSGALRTESGFGRLSDFADGLGPDGESSRATAISLGSAADTVCGGVAGTSWGSAAAAAPLSVGIGDWAGDGSAEFSGIDGCCGGAGES
jgi:hypothetical protein